MPLRVRPVKLRDSLYLLIPVDIARLLGVASSSDFQLSLNENQETVKLVYELKKEETQTAVPDAQGEAGSAAAALPCARPRVFPTRRRISALDSV